MRQPGTYGLIVVALICAIAAAITAFRGPAHFEDHGVFAALTAVVLTGKVLLDWRSRLRRSLFEGTLMSIVLKTIRGTMNVFGSGLLLLVAISLWAGVSNAPANAFKGASWAGALAVMGAALFSGFLAAMFWKQRAGRRSYYSSAILNGLSTVAFLSVIVIWAMDH